MTYFQHGDPSEGSQKNGDIDSLKQLIKVLDESKKESRTQLTKILSNIKDTERFTKIKQVQFELQQIESMAEYHAASLIKLEKRLSRLTLSDNNNTTGEKTNNKENKVNTNVLKNTPKNNVLEYNPPEPTLLLSNNDSRGKFYEVRTSNGKEVRFYYEDPSAQLSEKLEELSTFPKWCDNLSSLCNIWHLDNITKGEAITEGEEVILRKVIQNSLGKKLYSFGKLGSTATEIFLELENVTKKKFPGVTKDKMWKKILIDKYCSNTNEIRHVLDNIILLEIYTEDPENAKPLDNKFINMKIYKCLSNDLRTSLMNSAMGLEELLNKSPREMITVIIANINLIKELAEVYEEDEKPCQTCTSLLRGYWNCPLKKVTDLRQGTGN
ncbi:gag protein NDAI_0G03580 [Naumovozyma dairenensis CBS 421]|uniref:Uncharacterized protein n=1 Tax=Naumovozyma dairenensis (strain ATCC 10597 / BCRC 20456 / CBS 421 / NBRC 0211 / NRRL Y-12639) TaxID=1071378 RepID=G0WEC4_NAUDC|nr:hypothetical protein NDAI_0G03580 [Naumovozyma dairenensis CBS 421]CCD26135.2 hypothetical protein NDAI_0G03580 [Naumovozyma dairenensis CBS 421]